MAPEDLARLLDRIPRVHDENVIVGEGTVDDAGVYRLTDDLCLVQTADLFPPVVRDPRVYGRIAAANALSDVYAMGGRPINALNLAGFPSGALPVEVLAEILRGGAEKVREAGCSLIGGHTWNDSEVKYGLSVTGIVHPGAIISNANARPGDRLILTKPLGTGVITTAMRSGKVSREIEDEVSLSMERLNKYAAERMAARGASAATDVTGYGLFGHATHLARASKVTLEFRHRDIPFIEGASGCCRNGFLPGGSKKNKAYFGGGVSIEPGIPEEESDLLFDAQTSGGLLICVAASDAKALLDEIRQAGDTRAMEVGEVLPRESLSIRLVK